MAGRPSELEAHTGAVVRLGQEVGAPTPLNTFVYHSLLPLERRARGLLVFPSYNHVDLPSLCYGVVYLATWGHS